jgi:hypothetical protein
LSASGGKRPKRDGLCFEQMRRWLRPYGHLLQSDHSEDEGGYVCCIRSGLSV